MAYSHKTIFLIVDKKKMKKKIFFYLGILGVLQACDPPVDCTDPKCLNSPIIAKLKTTLSDTNIILHVRDTLKMRFYIADTIATNQGTVFIKSVRHGSLAFDYYKVDTIISKSEGITENANFLIQKGKFAVQSTAVEFDYTTKELAIDFLISKKGYYCIQMSPQTRRLEVTEKSGKESLMMFNPDFEVNDSHQYLYLSRIGTLADRMEMQAKFAELKERGIGWYCFKVE
ncbi:MAG: hypothetical protein RL329_2689 [Bacteroidota bacterium]|jgi:hypothetical protein